MTHTANAGARTGEYDELLAGVLAADEEGIDIEEYLAAIDAGITHDELMVMALWTQCTLSRYIKARLLGQPHKRLLADQKRSEFKWGQPQGISVSALVDMLEAGVNHDEALAVRLAGISETAYLDLRDSGVTHEMVMEAVALAPKCLAGYMKACHHASHAEIMAVLAVTPHADLLFYGQLRQFGETHQAALTKLAAHR
jgi:hypothetical protein